MREYEPRVRGCFGFVDGTVIRILNPCDPDDQRAYYNGMDLNTAIKCLFCFGVDGTVTAAALNELGTKHDARVAEDSGLLEAITTYPRGLYLLGDIAFPASEHLIRPLSQRERHAGHGISTADLDAMNVLVARVRVAAEWGLEGVRKDILERYPAIEPYIDKVLPKKDDLFLTKCSNKITLISCGGGEPLFFQDGDGPFIPCLRLVHKRTPIQLTIQSHAIFSQGSRSIEAPSSLSFREPISWRPD